MSIERLNTISINNSFISMKRVSTNYNKTVRLTTPILSKQSNGVNGELLRLLSHKMNELDE